MSKLAARIPGPTPAELEQLPTELFAASLTDLLATLQIVDAPIEDASWLSQARHCAEQAVGYFEECLGQMQRLYHLPPEDESSGLCLRVFRRSLMCLLIELRIMVCHCDDYMAAGKPSPGGERNEPSEDVLADVA